MVPEPVMTFRTHLRFGLALSALAAIAAICPPAHAAEHITLRNGEELDCLRQEPAGDRIRFYLMPTAAAHTTAAASDDAGYIEVPAASVLRVEIVPDSPVPKATAPPAAPTPGTAQPTSAEMRQMLDRAGAQHNIDADLLASIVHAESNGNVRAVSRAGARGLMQLMPSTASQLGVANSFAPDQNISGGTTYLDQLLTRYDPNNDDAGLERAVAAYNAGPAAVDRYHGIPPYAETRAYVARVVTEFNRRTRAALATAAATRRADAVAINPAQPAASPGLMAAN
jgi:soluble lytic murein transglycosylase-like protein